MAKKIFTVFLNTLLAVTYIGAAYLWYLIG